MLRYCCWLAGAMVCLCGLEGLGAAVPPADLDLINLHLLSGNKAVQKDLRLTEEQRAKLNEARKKLEDFVKKTNSSGVSPENQEKIRDEQARLTEGLLSAEQTARMRQFAIQSLRLRAFEHPEVVKALSLSEDQLKKCTEIRKDYETQVAAILKKYAGKPVEASKNIEPVRVESWKKVDQELKEDQKNAWKKLVGTVLVH